MSIGERVRWDMPVPCPRCGGSAGYDITPQPELRQRIKCKLCLRAWTVDPELTDLGLQEATSQYLAGLRK